MEDAWHQVHAWPWKVKRVQKRRRGGDYKKHKYHILLLLTPMTKHVVVRRPMIPSWDFNSTKSIPQATVKYRVEVTDDSCKSSSLRHIQAPIDALRRPLRGGSLRGGRAGDRRTRRSKRGDHVLANPAFDETWNQGSWMVWRRTLAATTCQLAARANIMGKSSITLGGLWLGGRWFPSYEVSFVEQTMLQIR